MYKCYVDTYDSLHGLSELSDIVETPSFKNVLLFTKALFVLSKILFVLQKNLLTESDF